MGLLDVAPYLDRLNPTLTITQEDTMFAYWLESLLLLLGCVSLVVWQSKYRKCTQCNELTPTAEGYDLLDEGDWMCRKCNDAGGINYGK